MSRLLAGLAFAFAAFALVQAGRAQAPAGPPAQDPALLSEWGQLVIEDGRLVLGEGVEPYALNSALFTDYAHKLRTIWLPPGTSASWNGEEVLDFPVGTVITKTFFYPLDQDAPEGVANAPDLSETIAAGGIDLSRHRLIETRLLVRREEGWRAFPYVWDADQNDARLARIGAVEPMTLIADDGGRTDFAYVVPNQVQCAACHAVDSRTRALSPIGPRPRHLNRETAYPEGAENQLARLSRLGLLTGAPDAEAAPRAVDALDASAPLEDRARAYLDINCAHCHSPVGPADTSGLHLGPEADYGPHLGVCKPPIAAGTGSGGRRFSIVPGEPEASILLYRMESTDPAAMMPELGRSLSHAEGVDLIRAWVATLEGGCG